eukprot:9175625-Pyramimonas_sp.AAC.1
MLGWIHTDETLSLIPGHMPQLSPEAQALVQSVPWKDDGRLLCANFHWVRTVFGHCPSCSNPIDYKRRAARDYLFQTWKDKLPRVPLRETAFRCVSINPASFLKTAPAGLEREWHDNGELRRT